MKSFFILVIFLIVNFTAKSEIIYTDISPDTTIMSNVLGQFHSYLLDVNKDGTAEFEFWQHHYFENVDACQIFCSETIQTEVQVDDNEAPKALEKDDEVSVTQRWRYSPGMSMDLGYNFKGTTDKYLGLRIKAGTSWKYGWIRLDVNQLERSMVLKDFAYETIAGKSIKAGETAPTLVEISDENMIKISIQGQKIDVDLNTNTQFTRLFVYNLLGSKIIENTFYGNHFSGNFDALNPGLYLIELIANNQRFIRKFVVE